MRPVYETQAVIVPSLSDHRGLLSVPGIFRLFQDLAAVHAHELECGYQDLLKKDLYWLTVKTRVEIRRRPAVGETVTLRTWPEAPGKLRCNRSYELEQDGEILIAGKTEWTILNFKENRLSSPREIYPEGLRFREDSAITAPFARIPEQFESYRPYAFRTVRSTDIDMGHHMNNVAYLQALAGSFSTEEWDRLPLRNIDVLFRASCFEGDELVFSRRDADDSVQVRIARGEQTILLVNLA